MKRIPIFLLYLTLGIPLCATATANDPAIKVIAEATIHTIRLRWATNTPESWQFTNQCGFRIERITILRDNHLLMIPEKIVLNKVAVKPQELTAWIPYIKENPTAAVIAQALYGKYFSMSTENNRIVEIINQSTEQVQRYTASMLVSDHCFPCSLLAGSGFVDSSVHENEKYLYRISPWIEPQGYRIDTGLVFVSPLDTPTHPPMHHVSHQFNNRAIMLSWNTETLQPYYTAYQIERSIDQGKHFVAISKEPFANTTNTNIVMVFDSLADNKTVYQYRVRGMTAFGELGPASLPIIGHGIEPLTAIPVITKQEALSFKEVQITWTFDQVQQDLLKNFRLNQAQNIAGPYKTIVDHISPLQRTISYYTKEPTSYITITAIGKDSSQQLTSLPVLVMLIDSIPPQAPKNVRGSIDSNGVVRLSWNKNKEDDLLGYRVLFANAPKDEFTVRTTNIIQDTLYKDTLSLETLNKKIFYKIVALDKHYNQSNTSSACVLEKPNIIPPTNPLFTNYKITGGIVTIYWMNSPDNDIISHELYRRIAIDSSKWQLLAICTDKTNVYRDSTARTHTPYLYNLVAKNKAGLKTPTPVQLKVYTPVQHQINLPVTINYVVNREEKYIDILWKNPFDQTVTWLLLKAPLGKPLTPWRTITEPTDQYQVRDDQLIINTPYQYGIQAFLSDGTTSVIKEVQIMY
ncbi:MAG: hypothetical protein QM528_01435 [Phycisphaerales bacterium]|nr:hypothetical protein [Phycisphaerales bacterium]